MRLNTAKKFQKNALVKNGGVGHFFWAGVTETGTEAPVSAMSNIAGGPIVDQTPTGGSETLALTSAQVAEEPRGDPRMV